METADKLVNMKANIIKVSIEKLMGLSNAVEELVINKAQFKELLMQLSLATNFEDIKKVTKKFTTVYQYFSSISDQLQDLSMDIRMVPIAEIFNRIPIIVRDISRKLNKRVKVIIEGEDTELDRIIIEELKEPLVHIIRNSIDHGIEMPDVRQKKGKTEEGIIKISAKYEGDNIVISIKDDGGGIDIEKIKSIAIKKGIINKIELENMNKEEFLNLIFMPGFSTADKINDISGRGVGMDVVKTNIEKLNGIIIINSEINRGTEFIIKLPLTVSIMDVILVESSKNIFCIPEYSIKKIYTLKEADSVALRNRLMSKDESLFSIISLAEIFNLKSEYNGNNIIIIEDEENKFGIIVDKIIGREDIIIKKLGEYLGKIEGVMGATILGTHSTNYV